MPEAKKPTTRKPATNKPVSKAATRRAATKAAAADGAPDPNKLVRRQAGAYRTADDRFEVRQSAIGWYLVDSEATNEFGQELVRGPFGTLDAVREALPDARRLTIRPLTTPKTAAAAERGGAGKRTARPAEPPETAETPKPPPPPPSWIDRLPRTEAAAVRRLIAALEREGLADAEALVKADREGRGPVVATALVERRLEAMAAGLPEALPDEARDAVRRLVDEVAELLTVTGSEGRAPLPGWSLVEIGPEGEPANRRITVRRHRRRGH